MIAIFDVISYGWFLQRFQLTFSTSHLAELIAPLSFLFLQWSSEYQLKVISLPRNFFSIGWLITPSLSYQQE